MKKLIFKYTLLLICMLIAAPMVIQAKDDKKEKKEKKPYEWNWDKTPSGNKEVDDYLLAVDSVWYQMQDLNKQVETYTYKEDTILVNGKFYIAAHMEDPEGNYITRGTVNWQFFNTTMLSANIVLKATNISLQTAIATTALPSLGLKALSYGKYVKAGPKIIGLATTGVKDIWTKTKAQSKRWNAMKQAGVDPEAIGMELTDQQKEVYNKCIYIIEINETSEDYTAIKEIYDNKSEEQIKQERDKYLKELASITVLPSEESKSLENLDDSELDKYAL